MASAGDLQAVVVVIAVYIAGPFRAETPWGIEQNVRVAEAMALDVARLGMVPVVPHTMYRHFDQSLPDQFWLDATLDLMRRCDAMLMLKAWQASRGATREHNEFRGPTFLSIGALATWYAAEQFRAQHG